ESEPRVRALAYIALAPTCYKSSTGCTLLPLPPSATSLSRNGCHSGTRDRISSNFVLLESTPINIYALGPPPNPYNIGFRRQHASRQVSMTQSLNYSSVSKPGSWGGMS